VCAFLFGFTVRRTGYTPTATAATVHGRGGRSGRRGRSRKRRSAARRGAWRRSAWRSWTGRHRRHVRPTPTATTSRPSGPPKHGRSGSGGCRGCGRTAPPPPSATASGAPPATAAAAATAAATATPRVGHVPFGGRGRCGRYTAEPRFAGRGWWHACQQSHIRRCVRGGARSTETRQGFDLRVSHG